MSIKSAPPPPDYKGAAEAQAAGSLANTQAQTAANRSAQANQFGSTGWSFNPKTGQWTQASQLSGPLGEAAEGLKSQAASNLGQPLQTGEAARNQAIQAAYGQATSRLDPQFGRQQEALDAQLANEGVTGGAAERNARNQFAEQRNDAYNQAMFGAIGQGTQAGQVAFQQGLEARRAPLMEIGALEGIGNQPAYNPAGRAESPQELAAAAAQGNYQLPAWEAQNQANADIYSGGANLLKSFFPMGGGS